MACTTLKSRLFALAFAGLATCATPAAAADTEITFCNKTGAPIQIAMAAMDAKTGKWTLTAWHTRKPGECKAVGVVRTGLFYYFAEQVGGKSFWPSKDSVEKNYCVPQTRVSRDMANSSCASGDKTYGFRGRVTETPKYTFSFS